MSLEIGTKVGDYLVVEEDHTVTLHGNKKGQDILLMVVTPSMNDAEEVRRALIEFIRTMHAHDGEIA